MNMNKRILSVIASASIFATAAINVQAEEVVVNKGDTLWDFSQEYGVSVESIKTWNNLSSDLIHPKDVLEVSSRKEVTVKKGDTLWEIAQNHKVTVKELMAWNKLSSDLIHPGLKLTIYPDLNSDKVSTFTTASVGTKTANNEVANAVAEKPAPESKATQSKAEPTQPAKDYETVDLQTQEATGKEITVEATAYTASCEGCSGVTATGVNLKTNPEAKVISVDPSVIPLGSKVYVEGYGYATAADTGGAIKGNKIDVFVPDYEDAVQWGRKQVKVTVIE